MDRRGDVRIDGENQSRLHISGRDRWNACSHFNVMDKVDIFALTLIVHCNGCDVVLTSILQPCCYLAHSVKCKEIKSCNIPFFMFF